MLATRTLTGLSLCVILNIESAICLSCVQCSTILEEYKERCKSGEYSPQPCPQNSTHCIKYEGSHEHMDFVFRDCLTGEVENGCRHQKIEKDLEIEMCYYACSQDGCNAGKIQRVSSLSTTITMIVLYIYL